MWTNTIGQKADPQSGSNSAIEAAINAPQFGAGRVARRAAAAEAVKQTGKLPMRGQLGAQTSIEQRLAVAGRVWQRAKINMPLALLFLHLF